MSLPICRDSVRRSLLADMSDVLPTIDTDFDAQRMRPFRTILQRFCSRAIFSVAERSPSREIQNRWLDSPNTLQPHYDAFTEGAVRGRRWCSRAHMPLCGSWKAVTCG